MKLTLKTLFAAALMGVAMLTALTIPAAASLKSVSVLMPDGSVQAIVLDVPKGATLQDIRDLVPGRPIAWKPAKAPAIDAPPQQSATTTTDTTTDGLLGTPEGETDTTVSPQDVPQLDLGDDSTDESTPGAPQKLRFQKKSKRQPKLDSKKKPRAKHEPKVKPVQTKLRNTDGSPAPTNPGFMDTLPGPSSATGVPNFVIRKFRVPPFLLPIYQAAGIQYGVRWEVLAAINEIETDYGRNLNVSSAGALGWMQFIPSSWKMYGVDANKDGKKDPYNPVDAIFATARYLKAAGYEQDPRRAVFAYNHAGWYVDSVMLRARLIAGVPSDLIGSLTGLTEGRFPVAARARYADDLDERDGTKKVKAGENAANIVESDDSRQSLSIYSAKDAPVVATNDGIIKQVGQSKRLGRYVVLQDVYGNRYTYSGLGSTAKAVPVPRDQAATGAATARALAAHTPRDHKPLKAASKGIQPESETDKAAASAPASDGAPVKPAEAPAAPAPQTAVKQRLFAHPDMPASRDAGGMEQLLDSKVLSDTRYTSHSGKFAAPVKLDPKRFKLTPLKVGTRVIGGTVLGRVGRPDADKAAHLNFSIRPAGKGAPEIDPKPILDGWKLLEATSIYRASGRNALRTSGESIGQILLLPKPLLEKRVLADARVDIYAGGREDIKSGQIDRRVLATLEYLAESGLRPTVTCLKDGHGFLTASGNVSEHSSGNAVDIGAINGIPILGHQERGGITEQTVRRLMQLQGTLAPHQIISLLDLGSNTLSLPDHANHIHVGFQPRFGANSKLGAQAQAALRPGQWPQLLKRLEDIKNPVVPTKVSPYAIPTKKK